ncbi:MAG: polymer-forming cytoskeletal protein, partial [Deltaproteobacteria bacterium]
EYLELQAKAKVSGDVYYRALEIQLGATIEGVLVHQDRVEQAKKTAEIALADATDAPAING